jgi:hypothetical protein
MLVTLLNSGRYVPRNKIPDVVPDVGMVGTLAVESSP